jgi:hypothetical protein
MTMSLVSTGPVLAAPVAPIATDAGILLPAQGDPDISRLPSGFPAKLNHDLCWIGPDFTHESDYIFTVTETHKNEIISALQHFKCKFLTLEKDCSLIC